MRGTHELKPHLIRVHGRLKHNRDRLWHKRSDLLESKRSGIGEPAMRRVRGDFTEMDLLQARAEVLQDEERFGHRRIELSGVTEVQTERGIREMVKAGVQLCQRSAYRFSVVHVLDTDLRAEPTPQRPVVD